MSGICGIFSLDGTEIDEEQLRHMLDRLSHRGTAKKTFVFESAGFGFISKQSTSPFDLAGPLLLLDGFIENQEELLKRLGEAAEPKNDPTGLLTRYYRRFGEALFNDVKGHFIIVLLDKKKQMIYLYRDPVGPKPFYYLLQKGKLYFASEIKALLSEDIKKPEISKEGLHSFFMTGALLDELTLFEGIYRIRLGELYACSKKGFKLVADMYLASRPELTNAENVRKKLSPLIDRYITSNLDESKSIGVAFSGGGDSSLMLYWLRRWTKEPITAFHCFYRHKAWNPRVDLATKETGADLRAIELSVETVKEIPHIIWRLDDLCNGKFMFNDYNVAKAAQKAKKELIFFGNGADLFGDSIPLQLYLLSFLTRFLKNKSQVNLAQDWNHPKVQKASNLVHSFPNLLGLFLLSDSFAQQCEMTFSSNFMNRIDRIIRTNSQDYLHQLLGIQNAHYKHNFRYWISSVRVESAINSFGCSRQCNPLLSHNVVETVSRRLSPHLAFKDLRGKYPLRYTAKGILPKAIIEQKKTLDPFPVERWMPEYEDHIRDMLKRFDQRSYLKPGVIGRLLRKRTDPDKIWFLYCLEIWHQTFLDQERIKPLKLTL